MAMKSGKVQSPFRPVELNSQFFAETSRNGARLTAVRFKRKIARIFLQLFVERITICLTERSSLGVTVMDDQALSWNVPSVLNLTIPMCTDVLEQRNLAAVSRFVYPSQCKLTICALRTSVKDEFCPLRGSRDV